MNSNFQNGRIEVGTLDESLLTRREAIKRTALLLGLALTPKWLDGVAHAQTQVAAGTKGPKNLTAAEYATVAAVADRIIPKTDTPGASEVGVPAFIDTMAGDYMTKEERSALAAGLLIVEKRALAAHSKGFGQLTAAQQDEVLKALATSTADTDTKAFRQIRDLTVTGYFTSEQVGRHVTNFEPIPGRFEACVPLTETGNRSWTR